MSGQEGRRWLGRSWAGEEYYYLKTKVYFKFLEEREGGGGVEQVVLNVTEETRKAEETETSKRQTGGKT